MVTDKEIIGKQLKRINEKMHTAFGIHYEDGACAVVTPDGDFISPPYPLCTAFRYRTEEQMIEYLRGVEDAVDFYTHGGTA